MGCGASQPSGPSFEPGRRGSVITASRLKDLQRGGHKRGGQSIARTAAPALPPSQPGRTSAVFYTFGEPSQGKATGYRRGSLTSVANGIFHLAVSHTPGALPALTDFPAALADGHGLTSPRSRASATEPKMTPSRASMRASVASVGQHATNARQSYVSRLGKDDLDDLWETESHADDEGSFKPEKKGTDASPREHTSSSTTSTVTSQESAPATPRNHSKPLRVQRSAEMGADPAAMNGDGLPFAEDIVRSPALARMDAWAIFGAARAPDGTSPCICPTLWAGVGGRRGRWRHGRTAGGPRTHTCGGVRSLLAHAFR